MCFLWKLSIDFIRSFIDGSSTSLVLNFCNFFSKFSILSLFLKCSWFRFSPILYGLSAYSADSVLCCTETFKRHVVSAADTWGHFLFCLESSSLHGVLFAASSFGFSRFKWKVWLWVYNHTAWMHACSLVWSRSYFPYLWGCKILWNAWLLLAVTQYGHSVDNELHLPNQPFKHTMGVSFLHQNKMDLCLDFEIWPEKIMIIRITPFFFIRMYYQNLSFNNRFILW